MGESNDIILVLGTTGAGKSTLVQFLAGPAEQLVSRQVHPNRKEYLIEGGGDRIGSGVASKTKLPEVVVDPV